MLLRALCMPMPVMSEKRRRVTLPHFIALHCYTKTTYTTATSYLVVSYGRLRLPFDGRAQLALYYWRGRVTSIEGAASEV